MEKYKHVIVIGIDGAGAFIKDADTPSFDRIFARGAVTYRALASNPTISAECWGSMLLGVGPEVHKLKNEIVSNRPYPVDAQFPTVFRRIRGAIPDAVLGSFCEWNSITFGIVESDLGVHHATGKDIDLTVKICDFIKERKPLFLFCQIDSVDGAGHHFGYGSEGHLNQMHAVDSMVNDIYEAVKSAGIIDDTLFMVIADHGGTPFNGSGASHGGWSDAEKYVTFAAAGPGVKQGNIGEMNVRDLAAIVLYALGLDTPAFDEKGWTSQIPEGLFYDVNIPEYRDISKLTGAEPMRSRKQHTSESEFPSPYRLGSDGVTIYTDFAPGDASALYVDEDNMGRRSVRQYERYMNRGMRCEETVLFGGDLPVLGFGTFHREDRLEVPMLCLGEFGFSIEREGRTIPFTKAAKVHTEYFPGGVRWDILIDKNDTKPVRMEACLLGGNSMAVRLEAPEKADLSLNVGNPRLTNRNLDATWLRPDCSPIPETVTKIPFAAAPRFHIKTEDGLDRQAQLTLWCGDIEAEVLNDTVNARFMLGPDNIFAAEVLIPAQDKEIDPAWANTSLDGLCGAIANAETEAKRRLFRVELDSGDPYLDNGFHNSVQELDYVYWTPAWLECNQFWRCYWTNNYQISAALALGDNDRAAGALRFFGQIEAGYNATTPLGNPDQIERNDSGEFVRKFDGMPYYLYQLYRYIDGVGEKGLKLLEDVFDNIHKNNLSMIAHCDPEGTGLYGWHPGCNSFMYQADHLTMPGYGTSPSIMIASGFRLLAKLLRKAGKVAEADFYEEHAERTFGALGKLWSEDCFVCQIDAANDADHAHYYTDLVFPSLYGDIDNVRGLLCLLHLRDTLIYDSPDTGLPLVKVGDLLPSLFAQDMVQSVGVAETALALFKMGFDQLSWGLLRSCGLAYSVNTESPGSAPERFSFEGRGEANYGFGNPAAVFPLAVVEGLLGLQKKSGGNVLRFAPARLPSKRIAIDWLGVNCVCENDRYELTRTARVEFAAQNEWKQVEFSICVPGGNAVTLYCNGAPLEFTSEPLLGEKRITAVVPAQDKLIWELKLEQIRQIPDELPVIYRRPGEAIAVNDAAPGQAESFTTPGRHHVLVAAGDCYIDQPVEILPPFTESEAKIFDREMTISGQIDPRYAYQAEFKIGGYKFQRKLAADEAGQFACIFTLPVRLLLPAYIVNYRLTSENGAEEGQLRAVNTSFIDFAGQPVELDAHLNTVNITGDAPWRSWATLKMRLSGDTCRAITRCDYSIVRNEEGYVRVCRLDNGKSETYTRRIAPGIYPKKVELEVDRAVGAISLLYQGDVDVRLTGALIGYITLSYDDGKETRTMLESGKTIGSLFRNYAKDTVHVPVDCSSVEMYLESVNHLVIPCDDSRVLRKIAIELCKEDSRFALIAVNTYSRNFTQNNSQNA